MFNKTMWHDLLNEKKMKQLDMAQRLGLHPDYLSQRVNDRAAFTELEKRTIVDFFGLNAAERSVLFGDEPPIEIPEPTMRVCMEQWEDGHVSIEAECDSVGLMQMASALVAEAIRKGMKDRNVSFIQSDLLHIMQYAVEQMDGEHDV